jgi:multiple sugar transport system substrate-binding protein
MVSTMSGRGPHVFVIHASTLPRMVRTGFVGDVADIYTGPSAIPPSDFERKVLDQVRFGTKMIGVPLDVHPQGLYGNSDMLLAAGLKNANGTARLPTNRDEFFRAIRATQKIGPDGQHDVWGFSWTMWRNNFMSLVPQFHGHYFDASGNADLANPGNVAALSFMADLLNKWKLAPLPESNTDWTGFRQKKVAMVMEGVYMVGDLKTMDNFHYLGGVMPQIGDVKGTLGDSHCLCVRANLTPAERSASERFIRYLSEHSLDWAIAGQVPARLSVRNSDTFKKLQVQYAFSKSLPYLVYPPRSPLLFELTEEIDLGVEKVLRGRATALQALQSANATLQKAIDRDRQENATKTGNKL